MSDEKNRTAEEKAKVLKIGSGEVNADSIPVLTMGDRVALKAAGVDFGKLGRREPLEPEEEVKLLLHIVKKRRPETTEEEAMAVPAMLSQSFIGYFLRRSAEVDDPFSTRSISSAPPTGGEPSASEASQQAK